MKTHSLMELISYWYVIIHAGVFHTWTPNRKVNASPDFPALAVLPTLQTHTDFNGDGSDRKGSSIHRSWPVNVGPDILRRIVIHNTFDPTDVDSSGSGIRTDQPSERKIKYRSHNRLRKNIYFNI